MPTKETGPIARFYTLKAAKQLTKEDRNLITFLVNDRQIPTQVIGRARVLDENGFQMLKEAIAEYRSRPEPVAASA